MDNRKILKNLITDFKPNKLTTLLRRIAPNFRPQRSVLDDFIKDDWPFDSAQLLGVIELSEVQTVLVAAIHVKRELTSRSGRKIQYELGKRILKNSNHNAGIFVFYDDVGRFRMSLITVAYSGTRRQFSSFRRYTFFVDPDLPNKTFVNQIGRADFSSLGKILEAFSLEAVSNAFYEEFKPKFDAIAGAVSGTTDPALRQDFALLFAIRVIFLGFVQKKGWLGGNPRFLQDFWQEYRNSQQPENTFYHDWLEPLFFEALNSPPGRKVAYGRAPFSRQTQEALQMAPYLNGELFKRKKGVDDQGLWIPDDLIGDFFDFLFQYNFTVEENELYDEELELNPEFLGIIFERITNMDQGAVYTPRVEVDLMCRLALVKWLEQTTSIDKRDLYHLFFREAGTGEAYDEYQKQGDFSAAEIRTLIEKLESVTVCDPAAGSGAFEVGMLQVLEQILDNLYSRNNTPGDLKANAPTPFERKKAIIANSLYGVEVKRWAVWINHLRLWLTLFVDMPDISQHSVDPLLPNLTFKVRTGDSLVQRIGGKTFPVHGHANLPPAVKRKITELKKKKRDFFYNKSEDYRPIEREELAVFRAILDAEIEARRNEIRRLRNAPKAATLFALKPTEKDRKVERTRQERIAALEAEIADLEAQKRNLKDERPFIWSIEFAEIFFDRGGFDIIIGNPPYLSVHSKDEIKKISDPVGRLKSKKYKDALMEMVRIDFPDYFAKSRAQTDTFKNGRKPSGRSDLYTYFYIRSLRLLNERGVHVFICSNAWLDVEYAAWLQEFFLRQACLDLVIDNHAKRSFGHVDVNTIITVCSKSISNDTGNAESTSQTGTESISPCVRFVAFKRPFEDAVLSENLLAITEATDIIRTEVFCVYPVTVEKLLAEGSEGGKYVGDKWGGKYLRAPNIIHKVFKSKRTQLLGEVSQIMGYVHDSNVGIKYPKVPFIKSVRYIRKIMVTSSDTILMGVNPKGNSLVKADLLFPRTFNDVHLILWNKDRFAVGKEFYRIIAQKVKPRVLALLLNSTFSVLQRELLGLHNLGGGAIKFSSNDVRLFLIPERLNVDKFNMRIFDRFLCREMNSIFTECGIDPTSDVPIAEQEPNPLPDRKALDDIVFDALGLTEEERKEVYRAVCQLVWERISRARSVRQGRGR